MANLLNNTAHFYINLYQSNKYMYIFFYLIIIKSDYRFSQVEQHKRMMYPTTLTLLLKKDEKKERRKKIYKKCEKKNRKRIHTLDMAWNALNYFYFFYFIYDSDLIFIDVYNFHDFQYFQLLFN